ncbi:MAG: class I SAM-dependent methyltransferase [Solirubrobacteraceae bacterium]
MTSKEHWLAAMWPSVRSWLPAPPATVVELGCGSLGGFVPALNEDGYDAIGVDPAAPEGPEYRLTGFEHVDLPGRVDAIVASTSRITWLTQPRCWSESPVPWTRMGW